MVSGLTKGYGGMGLIYPDATAAVIFLDFLVVYGYKKLSLDVPTLAGE